MYILYSNTKLWNFIRVTVVTEMPEFIDGEMGLCYTHDYKTGPGKGKAERSKQYEKPETFY